jgi:DNA-binding IclR family transcriptional regulator
LQYRVSDDETETDANVPGPTSSRGTTVQSIVRALRLLEALGKQQAVSLTELSRSLDLHKSTIHRLLTTLQSEGYVRQDPETEKYSLGLKILGLANGLAVHLDVRQHALPVMQDLMAETGETVHLGILVDHEVMCLESVVSNRPNAIASMTGKNTHAHVSSMGKAILAFSPDDVVGEFLRTQGLPRLTPRTITDRAAFFRELELIRLNQFALNDEEEAIGIRCVAAPIWDHRGQPVAALSVAAPAARLDSMRLPVIAQRLVRRAQHITSSLGGTYAAKVTGPHHP